MRETVAGVTPSFGKLCCLVAMVLVAMVAALGSNLACGGAQTPARDPIAAAAARLEGRWTLREFTPEGALETPLQGLLGAQFGTLEVMFAPGQLTAAGPGVSAARRYRVDQFIGDDISLVIVDTAGVENRFAGRFVGAELHFRSLDEPWRGRGVLERAP